MCRQLNISHVAYYKWLRQSIPEQKSKNIKLAELIKSMMSGLTIYWDTGR